MKKPIPNSVCDDCLNTECVWRAPSWGTDPPVTDCPDKKAPPITNADRIRSMTNEEMAWELCRIQRMPFYKDDNDIDEYEVDCWAKWLKEEYKE